MAPSASAAGLEAAGYRRLQTAQPSGAANHEGGDDEDAALLLSAAGVEVELPAWAAPATAAAARQ
jgi:hypothetical protein